MANGRNLAIIDGYIGQNPTLVKSSNGTSIANFQVATSERYNDGRGNIVTRTEWHNITAFAGTADFIALYGTKGSFVLVTGKLQPAHGKTSRPERSVNGLPSSSRT